MRSLFIDTNIFLRYYAKEDEETYQACRQLLQHVAVKKLQAVTSTVVLSELYFVCKTFYKMDKTDCLTILRNLQSYKGLGLLDTYDFSATLDLFEQYKVKFVDSLIASLKPIGDGKMAVISYDKDFDKIAGVIRLEPSEVLKI